MSVEVTKAECNEFNWLQNQIEIMCDILNESDIQMIEAMKENDQHYFILLDQPSKFIDEVTRLSGKLPLIRAFWVVNLVYLEYYRKTKYNNLQCFYVVRSRESKKK
jgi:hypothetical protein